MDDDDSRNAIGFKSRAREIGAQRAGLAGIVHPEPLNLPILLRNARVRRRRCGRRGLGHDFRPYGDDGGGDRAGVRRDSREKLATVEGAVDVEMNQVLDVFLICFCRTIAIHA
jgi:hypothetical protein